MNEQIDERMGQRLRLRIIQEAIRSGELSLQGKNDEDSRRAVKEYLEKYIRVLEEIGPREMAGDVEMQILVSSDYTHSLLAQAEDFVGEEKLDFAVMFYATWAEHWANQVISIILSRRDFGENMISEVIREASFKGKITWLIALLDIPEIPDVHVNTLQRLAEIRNGYVHYKWKFQPIETLKDKESEVKKLVGEVEQTVKYLQEYLADNHIALPDDKLLKFMT